MFVPLGPKVHRSTNEVNASRYECIHASRCANTNHILKAIITFKPITQLSHLPSSSYIGVHTGLTL